MSLTLFLWSFLVYFAGKRWWRWWGVKMPMGEWGSVRERCFVLRENEKKRRDKNECMARQREKRDILQMSGGEQKGRWGHTCDPLKSNPPPLFFFFWLGHYISSLQILSDSLLFQHSNHSLSLSHPQLSFSPKLSHLHGTQVPKKFLRAFWRCVSTSPTRMEL